MQVTQKLTRTPSFPLPLSPHRRRASFTGAPESPLSKNSTENSNEALSFRGEAGWQEEEEGAEGDWKHHRSSSSLQRHCLSDGVFLVVEEAKDDDGLTVSTREGRERERQRT